MGSLLVATFLKQLGEHPDQAFALVDKILDLLRDLSKNHPDLFAAMVTALTSQLGAKP